MSIRIVLVGTSHPGNIGSAARAMKTMGLESLYLVAPLHFPATEATTLAAGADDVLAERPRGPRRALGHRGLRSRGRHDGAGRHLPWRIVEPREAALEIAAASQASEVAILFGAERSGLHNDDLQLCHTLLTIPTGSAYTSLNLAMAVQVVTYEVCNSPCAIALAPRPCPAAQGLGSARERRTDMEKVLRPPRAGARRDRLPRPQRRSGYLMSAVASTCSSAPILDQNEMNILRGIPHGSVQGKRTRVRGAHQAHAPTAMNEQQADHVSPVSRVIYLDNAATTPVDPAGRRCR
jgi:tRNA C32,U32 (ribose-2'-O)-methylase TrmJ